MEENLKLLAAYKPVIMLDKKEPFEITAVACTVFHETKRSSSFPKREIEINPDTTAFAIEYAIWYDYDIQHLYEMEHVWVYVGHDKTVRHVEASFHGKYLNMVNLDTEKPVIAEGTHPLVYAQPGKHALLPDQRLIRLIPDWWESCMEKAGSDGILVPDMFETEIATDEELQKLTCTYIRERFGFRPAMEFQPFDLKDGIFITWEALKSSIPERVNRQIEIIREYGKKRH